MGEITKNPGWVKAKKIYADADKEGICQTTMLNALKASGFKQYDYNKGRKGGYTLWYDTTVFPNGFPVQLALEDARA